ncbi:DUF3710 domain-containing protein [Rhodococcus sp. (in: high G+C Gram-positive bacteria)]|uniref:DUF3710 domain-containing protein n=1 Tax=Rhodococcus sp. TaxID=1831 RepID=UPI00389037BC
MFGRRKNRGPDIGADRAGQSYADDGSFDDAGYDEAGYDEAGYDTAGYDEAGYDHATGAAGDEGPFDITEIDEEDLTGSRLDLGSVLVPLPQGSQIQVEMAQNGAPQNVHIVTRYGRITVSAYAAPKSPGQWREVAAELSETLRNDNATVSMESGPWGRELHGVTSNADLRFIGVDGPRWMIRCVVAGPAGNAGGDSELVVLARSVVAGTVVRRGVEPYPVRTPLPVVLPEALAQQLAAAAQQQAAARQQPTQQGAAPQQQRAPQGAPAAPQAPRQGGPAPQARAGTNPPPPSARQPQPPRRGESGSAMQQLGF